MDISRRFEGKTVVITGGAKGIGKACAQRFAHEGARVAVLDIDESAAKATAQAMGGMAVHCDVADHDSVQAAVQAVLKAWGRVDILFANAGVYRGRPLIEMPLEEWQFILNVNLTGVMLCCQAVAPALMKQQAGSIVIMSSMAGKTSWPATAAYSAAKTGVIGLMRSVAQELAPYNINCNAVCLGHAETEMLREVDRRVCADEGWEPGTFLKNLAESNPMKRLATAEETAALVAFLASDEARYINGQAIEIDGGLVMS
jgi:NAD(P)-dependent dehydrogenase (short-subunit alcohol dehydrogenase family)